MTYLGASSAINLGVDEDSERQAKLTFAVGPRRTIGLTQLSTFFEEGGEGGYRLAVCAGQGDAPTVKAQDGAADEDEPHTA